jgi:hypothetical protein
MWPWNKTYKTWKEASKACKKLHIRSAKEYRKRYKEDKRLPQFPNKYYKGTFPGWIIFFDK